MVVPCVSRAPMRIRVYASSVHRGCEPLIQTSHEAMCMDMLPILAQNHNQQPYIHSTEATLQAM